MQFQITFSDELDGKVRIGDIEFNRLAGVDFCMRPSLPSTITLSIIPEELELLQELTKENPLIIKVEHLPPRCLECGNRIIQQADRRWRCACPVIEGA